jgi:hypothetical protein
VLFFFQKLECSFWGSGSAERKKEWHMAIMIINENSGKKNYQMASNSF